MKIRALAAGVLLGAAALSAPAGAHYDNYDHATATQSIQSSKDNDKAWGFLELLIQSAEAANPNLTFAIDGNSRVVKSDGLPDHPTGAFPNPGNPNTIRRQNYEFRMPANPKLSGRTIPLHMNLFGVAVNGVPFDPGAAEWWNGDPSSGYQYEAMALGTRLGLDQNNAHVQPNGAYHYHGLPTGLVNELSRRRGPLLLGYAADGFPVYGPYGASEPLKLDSKLKEIASSYRLRKGSRSGGPGGAYDGLFVSDYEYVKGSGDLDDSNGRFGVTPEYPSGIYHYVITTGFPFVPRSFKGMPDSSFSKHPAGRPPHHMRGGFPHHPPGAPPFHPPGDHPHNLIRENDSSLE